MGAKEEKINILVADDEADIRDIVRYAMDKSGYQVVEAESGPKALEILRSGSIRLLILDVMLPGMDGHTLQMQMSQNAKMRDIPVIVLTAVHSTQSLFAKFPQVKHFISKPFDPTELVDAVRRVLLGEVV